MLQQIQEKRKECETKCYAECEQSNKYKGSYAYYCINTCLYHCYYDGLSKIDTCLAQCAVYCDALDDIYTKHLKPEKIDCIAKCRQTLCNQTTPT
jgi:hypothetical protein